MKTVSAPKPITDFSERCDAPNARGKWLGIARLTRVPDAGFPDRKNCQEHVTSDEAEAGADFIRRYREAEALERDINISLTTDRVHRLETAGGFDQTMEAQKLRETLRGMDSQKLIFAIEELRRLRSEAIEMCRPILERILEAFSAKLDEVALKREEELRAMGVSLFSEQRDARGDLVRVWELHTDGICNALHCRREIIRHRILSLDASNAVPSAQWLTTSEEHTPFQWLG